MKAIKTDENMMLSHRHHYNILCLPPLTVLPKFSYCVIALLSPPNVMLFVFVCLNVSDTSTKLLIGFHWHVAQGWQVCARHCVSHFGDDIKGFPNARPKTGHNLGLSETHLTMITCISKTVTSTSCQWGLRSARREHSKI